MFGTSDEIAGKNAIIAGQKKSIAILVKALKKIANQKEPNERTTALEALLKHQEQEIQTQKDWERA